MDSDDRWRTELDEEQFRVARCGGTEEPFTGRYWDHKATGEYLCVCCKAALFSSRAKFDSGSGWPSFHSEIAAGRVAQREDTSHGMARTEVLCGECGAHLGHLFEDGPAPTGLRYCVNSASLDFAPGD